MQFILNEHSRKKIMTIMLQNEKLVKSWGEFVQVCMPIFSYFCIANSLYMQVQENRVAMLMKRSYQTKGWLDENTIDKREGSCCKWMKWIVFALTHDMCAKKNFVSKKLEAEIVCTIPCVLLRLKCSCDKDTRSFLNYSPNKVGSQQSQHKRIISLTMPVFFMSRCTQIISIEQL